MRLDEVLQSKYDRIVRNYQIPGWAYPILPSIPFIGERYNENTTKCLVYASAENLTYIDVEHEKGNVCDIERIGDRQFNRHRELLKGTDPFPNIHLEPMNNGSLAITSRYILALLGYDSSFSEKPKEFIEEICIGNFGKFSIKPDQKINKGKSASNQDYASKFKYLKCSLDYVLADIEFLQPDILIIPKTIWNFAGVHKPVLSLLKKKTRVVKIYQTNRRVIGSHISKILSANPDFSRASFPFCDPWLAKINDSGINYAEMEKYVTWLSFNFEHNEETYF
jgi:hypothetical protein